MICSASAILRRLAVPAEVGCCLRPLLLMALMAHPALAQEAAQSPSGPQALSESVVADLERRRTDIDARLAVIDELADRLPADDSTMAALHEARIDEARSALFRDVIALARSVLELERDGFAVDAYKAQVGELLPSFVERAEASLDRIRQDLALPDSGLTAAEQLRADKALDLVLEQLDAMYSALVSFVEELPAYGIDSTGQRERLRAIISDGAANRSALLHLAVNQADIARAASSAIPDDAELSGLRHAADARVRIAVAALERSVGMLNRLGLERSQYRQQLISVTGEVTSDALDIGVVRGLLRDWGDSLGEFADERLPRILFEIFIFLLIIAVAVYIARFAKWLLKRAFASPRIQLSNLLETMITRFSTNTIVFVGVLIALSQIGVSLAPVLAGLGIAGFIIGFALQDSLSNFASGLLILFYRPFDVGDFVTAGGVTGLVSHMSLVNTTFRTPDNEIMVVPNNKVWQDVITNATGQRRRRIDLVFGISYSDDIDKAKALLLDEARNHASVLEDPAPDVRVGELADSSVNLLLRPWVNTADYFETRWDLIESVKKRFDKEGITIPFPQRQVHANAAVGAPPNDDANAA